MPDKKISDLTSAGALSGSEQIPLVQSGTTVKTVLSTLSTFVSTKIPLSYILNTTVNPSSYG